MSRANWEVVIGLETHAQLNTASKIFSGASTAFGAAPNVQASPVDLALPGVLPVMNRAAVERAIRFGLAIGATVAPRSVFARKNYFYPDLPKGYQITQARTPLARSGKVQIDDSVIRITSLHLEEDSAKTGDILDHNRAGVALAEIVTEPDLRSGKEAAAFVRELQPVSYTHLTLPTT